MNEPQELTMARRHLARAETAIATAEGLAELRQGLGLLDTVIGGGHGDGSEAVARNVGLTYTTRIYARVDVIVRGNDGLPEPELEHLFAVVRAFDDSGFDLPPESSELKIEIVKRLVDSYYQGYPPDEKEAAYRRLAELAAGRETNGASRRDT